VSFHWRRTIGAVVSTCAVCGWTIRSTERDVLNQQRAHDPAACQQRRLDAARAASPEGLEAARKLHVYELRNARHRELYAARRQEKEAS